MKRNNHEIPEFLANAFRVWAAANGVSLEYEDDWSPWWDCWLDGYNTGTVPLL